MKVQVFGSQPITADGNSEVFRSNGRKALLVVTGTFGGGTITVKALQTGSTYVTTGLTISAAGTLVVDLPKGTDYRFELSGSTTPSITANVIIDERN